MKRVSRRQFIKHSAGAAVALSLAGALDLGLNVRRAVAAAGGESPFRGIVNLKWPLFSQPAMLQPGNSLPIQLKSALTEMISAQLVAQDGSITELNIKEEGGPALPKGLSPGVYGLRVVSGNAPGAKDYYEFEDEQPRAVAVFPEFKDDFDFVYFADIHFGEHDGVLPDTPVTPHMAEHYKLRAKTLMEIQKRAPEFIVLGGDLHLYPKSYHLAFPESYAFLTHYLRSPLFIVPGNHDVYHMEVKERGGEHVYAGKYWDKYYGQRHHSFDYGKLHVACLNTSDWPDEFIHWGTETTTTGTLLNAGFQREQFDWMKADIEAATAAGRESAIMCHIPLHNIISGKKLGLPAVKLPGAPEGAVFDLFNKNDVNHVFVGHLHYNDEKVIADGIQEHLVRNVGGDYFESPSAGYAVVHVRGGRITGHDIVEVSL
jgi:hypothetical protein